MPIISFSDSTEAPMFVDYKAMFYGYIQDSTMKKAALKGRLFVASLPFLQASR